MYTESYVSVTDWKIQIVRMVEAEGVGTFRAIENTQLIDSSTRQNAEERELRLTGT
jgi:hypothetical protein